MKEYQQLIGKFKKFKVLVVGDFILDAYFQGTCTRLAPEAPVPVVDIDKRSYCLGGAANVAANLAALDAEVVFCTAVGEDEAAYRGKELLQQLGIATSALVHSNQRQTLLKTRIVTSLQPMLRFDEGTVADLDATLSSQLLRNVADAYDWCDAVIVADYMKGILSKEVIEGIQCLGGKQRKLVAVDSKRVAAFADLAPDLIKPNYEEVIKLLSLPFQKINRNEQLRSHGKELFETCKARIVAVTLDSEGSMLFDKGELCASVSAPPVVNQHVSGAGDTYISACLLALLSGGNPFQMAEIATKAAACAIEKENTALCYWKELVEALSPAGKYLSSSSAVRNAIENYKDQGKRIVFTNGCFDILHSGHVSYLNQAKQMGDVLIVGLNKDESIKRLKGDSRPINSLNNRVAVLAALSAVDHIIPFGEEKDDTPVNLIKLVKPDVFVKGGDYQNSLLPEQAILNKIGAETVFLPFVPHQSTTGIINKMDQGTKHKLSLLN